MALKNTPSTGFPGGSKKRVNRAGDAIRSGSANAEDYSVIEEWRAAHGYVLNTFQALLRTRTRDHNIIVAQRHKRRKTIYDKLLRIPTMDLARMDDVAGCRLIFKSIDDLNNFRQKFHKARFNHKLRHAPGKYDYLASPKVTGYRGIHDIYESDIKSPVGAQLRGLMVEIQYRTLVQHAWATANEVIGTITESQPKFERGDRRYQEVMALASEILARAHEQRTGPHPDLASSQLIRQFVDLDRELGLLDTFRSLGDSDLLYSTAQNYILIPTAQGLTVQGYPNATRALAALFEIEGQDPSADPVLVRGDSSEEVRVAFKNYYFDVRDFLRLIDEGCAVLHQRPTTYRNLLALRR